MQRTARISVVVAVAALTVMVAVPVTAQAATKSVALGTTAAAQKALQRYGADANDFFPHGITIHVGDSVKFLPTNFHTVDLPKKGGTFLPLLTGSAKISGAVDAAGTPFWFNGQDALGFNPALAPPGIFGKKVRYDGSKAIESGLPLAAKPKPFTITFKKAGSFTYYCDVHPGMKGVVTVKSKGAKIPTAAQDRAAVKAQIAKVTKVAKALAKTTAPANTVSVGASGAGGVESYAFFPSTLTVTPGTTVTFKMSATSLEVHTATTGPGDPEKDPSSYLGKLAASLQGAAFDQAAVYPSDVPPAPAALTATLHGNGFWNSGALDTVAASPLPASSQVTFAAAGTYEFYCMIHPFMHGTVVVQ
ncbi:MAG TPA: hypothetical protein VII98_01175 [Solirubrobacteraceae bacterium]